MEKYFNYQLPRKELIALYRKLNLIEVEGEEELFPFLSDSKVGILISFLPFCGCNLSLSFTPIESSFTISAEISGVRFEKSNGIFNECLAMVVFDAIDYMNESYVKAIKAIFSGGEYVKAYVENGIKVETF